MRKSSKIDPPEVARRSGVDDDAFSNSTKSSPSNYTLWLELGGRGVCSLPPILPWLRFVSLHGDRFRRPGQVTLHRAQRLAACTITVRVSFHFS